MSATSLFELDLVFDIERALSVFDCDRYYNFMCFAMVTFAIAGGPGEMTSITIAHGMAHMEMAETELHRKHNFCVLFGWV